MNDMKCPYCGAEWESNIEDFKYTDGVYSKDYFKLRKSHNYETQMRSVFCNGKMTNRESFMTIRKRLAMQK